MSGPPVDDQADKRVAARLARKARRQDMRRQALVDAALSLLRQRTASRFTMGEVAQRADVSTASVHYYFPSKEALVAAVVLRLVQAEADALVAVVEAAPNAMAALTATVRAKAARYAADPAAFAIQYQLTTALGQPEPATLHAIYAASDRVNGLLEARLKTAIRDGLLAGDAPAREIVNIAWFGAQGILTTASTLRRVGGNLRFPIDTLVDTLCDTLQRAWTAPGIG